MWKQAMSVAKIVISLLLTALLTTITVVTVVRYYQFKDQTTQFITQGKRFTAQDGQALCERVRILEELENKEHGYLVTPSPCEYLK